MSNSAPLSLPRRRLLMGAGALLLPLPALAAERQRGGGEGFSPAWRPSLRRPERRLVVAAGAAPGGDGSAGRPFGSLQAAADAATPGTLVLVRGGTYAEAVKFPSRKGGEPERPIVWVSADGPGAAKLMPPDGMVALKGLGVHDIALIGFAIQGGSNGVQFSQSGNDFSACCANLLVAGMRISGPREDGIKISQAQNVLITDNVVSDCGQQCVDFVNVWTGAATRNDLSGARVAAAVFAKHGSKDILFADNHIHDVRGYTVAGICVGGYANVAPLRPGSPDCEARHVQVSGNRVERIEGYPLSILGGQDVEAFGNLFESAPPDPTAPKRTYAVIGVGPGSPKAQMSLTRDLKVHDNVLRGREKPWTFDRQTQDPQRDDLRVDDGPGGDLGGGVRGGARLRAAPGGGDPSRAGPDAGSLAALLAPLELGRAFGP